MKISFLLHNAYGIGGTIRSTFNVAGALAARHPVEIVTVLRTRDAPSLPLHHAVRLTPLIDLREHADPNDRRHPALSRPTAHVPVPESTGASAFNALTDERVAAHLAATDADVVVATRPGLLVYLAEFGHHRYLRIGQEHRLYGTHGPEVRAACDAAIARLDAFTTVSEADAATHRVHLPPGVRTRLVAVPNGVPAAAVEPSDGTAKLVVAAGRLVPVKRYDLLVRAWARVAERHQDWHLRIYGRGPQHAALRRQVDASGLTERLTLMGPHSPIETEWAKGSIAAVTSSEESFGMTIVEAMHCGVPVVATDCPHGPGEIITDGVDGLLVPMEGPEGVARGLCTLIEDEALRRSMGRAARLTAGAYVPERVASAYEALFHELREELRDRLPRPPAHPAGRARRTSGAVRRLLRPRRLLRGAADSLGPTAPPGAGPDAVRGGGAVPGGAVRGGGAVRPPTHRKPGPSGKPFPSGSTALTRGAEGPQTGGEGALAGGAPVRPVAGCRVDAEGNLLVLIDPADLGRAGRGAAAGPGDGLALTLTRRHHGETVRVPLRLTSSRTPRPTWTAVLDRRSVELAEGRWDVHLASDRPNRGRGRGRRVACRYAEGRGLLGLDPLPEPPFRWWIPYATVNGNLAVRAWLRPAHAEARAVRAGVDALTVQGTLYGTVLTGSSRVVASARTAASRTFSAPATGLTGGGFRFTVRYDQLRAAHRGAGTAVWDLALRPGGPPDPALRSAGPIRVGRVVGDILDRHKTDLYPAVGGVRPYLTRGGNLALSHPAPDAP